MNVYFFTPPVVTSVEAPAFVAVPDVLVNWVPAMFGSDVPEPAIADTVPSPT